MLRPFQILLLLLPLLACTLSTPANPTPILPETVPASSQEGARLEGNPRRLPAAVDPAPFAPYTVQPASELANAPLYEPALSAINSPAVIANLSEQQQNQLAQTGFFISEDSSTNLWGPINRAISAGEPVLINSDLVLLATAAVHQRAWQLAQSEYLIGRTQLFNTTMANRMENQWRTLTAELDTATSDEDTPPQTITLLQNQAGAAWLNWVYFTTAAKLLDPAHPVPEATAEMVNSELALIGQGGQFVSPLLGDIIDYTPFTTAETNYEKTLVWYHQMPLILETVSPNMATHGQQVQLLLDDVPPIWRELYTTHSFFNGNATTSLNRWLQISEATASDPLDIFILTAYEEMEAPRFYILPPPQSADAPIITGLTYNRVGGYLGEGTTLPPTAGETAVGPVRLYPSPLDFPAVLGSAAALTQLQTSGDTAYTGFDGQFAGLRNRYVNLRSEISYTEGWFYALQPLLTPVPPNRPLYMTSPTWVNIQLNTWQNGWLLNRLNIAAPAVFPEFEPLPEVTVAVEPQLELYGRLAAQTRQLLTGLDQRGLLSQTNADELATLESTLYRLQALAQRQISGSASTAEEFLWSQAVLSDLNRWTHHITLPQPHTLYTEPTTGRSVTLTLSTAHTLHTLTLLNGQQTITTGFTLDLTTTYP